MSVLLLVCAGLLMAADEPASDVSPIEELRTKHDAYARIHVTGQVVDSLGAPVAGARLSTFWSFQEGSPVPKAPVTTDADGRFNGMYRTWFDPFGLVAYSADGQSAGYVLVTKTVSHDLTVEMRPTIQVRGSVVCAELGKTPEWINNYWMLAGDFVIECASTDGRIELGVPQGAWNWEIYDQSLSTVGDEVLLDGSQPVYDLGVIDLPATFVRRYQGKRLPEWTVTESRGLPGGQTQLADFRGKWILLEFWGHW